ncbi:MAG: hypothetical protein Q8K66_10055 [Sediminibacterium sp.]|nr:hypothetical protein [Sediminibacterium sp.]
MKECNVIIIDDRPAFFTSATIKNILRRASENHHLQINLLPLNPKEEKFVDDEGVIIPERLIKELDTTKYLKQAVHLIACDYDFGGDKTNGFEIIRILRTTLESKKRIILYSSNLDNVIDKILEGERKGIVERITDLVNSNISAFCKRDEHLEESIIKHLKDESQFSADKAFESELYKYKDHKFKTTYDKFENKTLGEVAELISKQKHEGEVLKQELIEQVIAYMIMMKNE